MSAFYAARTRLFSRPRRHLPWPGLPARAKSGSPVRLGPCHAVSPTGLNAVWPEEPAPSEGAALRKQGRRHHGAARQRSRPTPAAVTAIQIPRPVCRAGSHEGRTPSLPAGCRQRAALASIMVHRSIGAPHGSLSRVDLPPPSRCCSCSPTRGARVPRFRCPDPHDRPPGGSLALFRAYESGKDRSGALVDLPRQGERGDARMSGGLRTCGSRGGPGARRPHDAVPGIPLRPAARRADLRTRPRRHRNRPGAPEPDRSQDLGTTPRPPFRTSGRLPPA